MVIPKLSNVNQLSYQAKLSLCKPSCSSEKHRLRLRSTANPNLSTCNSQQPQPLPYYHLANQRVAAIVFGDGSESRLYPLTKTRSEGAIPLAGNYRLIDAVLSNCINSNIGKIFALTQFNSTFLNSHISRAYSPAGLGKEGSVEVIAAYQSPEDKNWFQGTADAVRRCLWLLEEYPVTEFLVLPGHHLYKMDYQDVIETHRNSKADVTIAALLSKRDHDPGFGNLTIDSTNQVIEFRGASEQEALNHVLVENTRHSNTQSYKNVSSMGVYVISRDTMNKLLYEYFPKANNFENEVIPGTVSAHMKVQAYIFDGYWEDMRNIEAYYEANMACTKQRNTQFSLYDRYSPVYTMPRCLPPTLITNAVITNSIIGDGCIIKKCRIKGTVMGMRTRIEDGALIEDSVILGSDSSRTKDVYASMGHKKGMEIPIGVGKDTVIRKAIVDENARIGNNVMIINKDNVQEGGREADGFIIIGGIVVVIRDAVIPDFSII